MRRDYIKNVDLTLLKDIRIRETMKAQLSFEALKAFNEPCFPVPQVAPTNSPFGAINILTTANQENYARRAQLGAKFIF